MCVRPHRLLFQIPAAARVYTYVRVLQARSSKCDAPSRTHTNLCATVMPMIVSSVERTRYFGVTPPPTPPFRSPLTQNSPPAQPRSCAGDKESKLLLLAVARCASPSALHVHREGRIKTAPVGCASPSALHREDENFGIVAVNLSYLMLPQTKLSSLVSHMHRSANKRLSLIGTGHEDLRGASGASLQSEGAVEGAVAGVLRPKGAETVPWPMHAGCGVLARQFVVNQLEEATRQRWRGPRVVEEV